MALLQGNTGLWSLVSESEETHKPSDFSIDGNTSSERLQILQNSSCLSNFCCASATGKLSTDQSLATGLAADEPRVDLVFQAR